MIFFKSRLSPKDEILPSLDDLLQFLEKSQYSLQIWLIKTLLSSVIIQEIKLTDPISRYPQIKTKRLLLWFNYKTVSACLRCRAIILKSVY